MTMVIEMLLWFAGVVLVATVISLTMGRRPAPEEPGSAEKKPAEEKPVPEPRRKLDRSQEHARRRRQMEAGMLRPESRGAA